jgi:hypothetical protein
MYSPGLVWAVLCPVVPGLGLGLGLNHVQPWVGLGCFVSSPPWFGVRLRAESCTALGWFGLYCVQSSLVWFMV